MAKTIHDQLCDGLRALGCAPYPSKNKYTMFKRNVDGRDRFYFVGKAGALRVWSRPNAADSLVASPKFRQMVLDAFSRGL